MGVRFEFDYTKALGPKALQRFRKRVADLLEKRVLDRIENGGDEEIRFAPLGFPRINKSTARPLYDTGAHLHTSITSGVTGNAAWVGSSMRGSAVLQWGTKGKQAEGVGWGRKPTIVPRRAKALFIPLTQRARASVRVSGPPPMRVYKKKGRKGRPGTVVDLQKGVDFILVSKVDLPPRPFLRLARSDRAAIADLLKGK
jgi:phage gpG-like protein